MRGKEEGIVKNDSWVSGMNNESGDVWKGDLWGKIKGLALDLLSFNCMKHPRCHANRLIYGSRAHKRGLKWTHEKRRHFHTDPIFRIFTLSHYIAII